MRDAHSGRFDVVAIGNSVLAADNTPAAIDLVGFDSAEISLSIGVGGITFTGANKIEFVLTHSDDDITYSNVTVDDVIGVSSVSGGIIKSLIAAHAAAAAYRFGYIGGKRYIKLLADFTGTHGTGTPIAATVSKSRASRRPQANQA